MKTLAVTVAVLALAPAASAAHPSDGAVRKAANSALATQAKARGDVDAHVNRVSPHKTTVAGAHYRTAFATARHRCGKRGVAVCVRPYQIDVQATRSGVQVIAVRVYDLHR